MRKIIFTLWRIPRCALALLIFLYQKTISPDHGLLSVFYPYGFCRHEPSCSEYGKQVLLRDGVCVGVVKIGVRLVRCNPWQDPDEDLQRIPKIPQT